MALYVSCHHWVALHKRKQKELIVLVNGRESNSVGVVYGCQILLENMGINKRNANGGKKKIEV